MNITVKVNDTQLRIKEYNGQRVVTFKDIDSVHGRVEGTAHRCFKSNREHLVEGVDYFRRNSSEAKTEYGVIAPNGLIILTESGYLMLVKSFTDELAWQVQRQLVSTYFKHREDKELPAKIDEPYRYIEKRWNGQVVATVRDLYEIWKPLSRYAIRYNVKEHLTLGKDYFLLKGKDLAQFKEDCNNDSSVKLANELFVVTYSGMKRLAKLLCNGDFEPIKKFELKAPPELQRVKWATRRLTDIPDNERAQKLISSAKSKTAAISELLVLVNRYNSETDFLSYSKTLLDLSCALRSTCSELSAIKPMMVEK